MVSWPELVSTALRGREMKQMFIVGHCGPEKLQLRESADPSPAAGEIRIRVKARGINFADILARQGLYPDSPKIPCVVGYEVSGLVDAVGADVNHSWVGRIDISCDAPFLVYRLRTLRSVSEARLV
jgi:D-arabinose 1-dehydrogenase-like Zn-dependent alcohol dehydrogenase